MPVYLLTRPETFTLSILLHLPVQPGSVLSAWLSAGEFPQAATDVAGESLTLLESKGYYSPEDKEQSIQPELLKSLALASVDAVEITAVIRRNGQAALTRFAQMGKSVAQYGVDEEHLSLHPVIGQTELVEKIIPDWFTVSQNERLQADLPLGAFLLFKQACDLADLASADTNFESGIIEKDKLRAQFNLASDWLKIFNAEGLSGANETGQMPLNNYVEILLTKGFLRKITANTLEIGSAGKSLAASFSDPDLCSLIVSLQTWEGGFPATGVFLYGGERLFLLEVKSGNLLIRQISDRQEGCSWVKDLLVEGSRARYADYVIAPAK